MDARLKTNYVKHQEDMGMADSANLKVYSWGKHFGVIPFCFLKAKLKLELSMQKQVLKLQKIK